MASNEKSTSWLSCIIHSFLLIFTLEAFASAQLPSDRIYAAKTSGGKSLVLLDQANLTVQQAYALQNTVVKSLSADNPVVGYKAGLTTKASASQYNLDQPVAGVLLTDMVSDIRLLKKDAFHAGKIEVELGYRLNQTLDSPIAMNEVPTVIDRVVAVVELPDLGFDKQEQLRGVDIIANNVGAKQLLVGKSMSSSRLDVEKMTVSLAKGETLIQEIEVDTLEMPQLERLHWLINQTITNGQTVEAGQLLITGSLGLMIDANVGRYTADFGPLGRIRFTIE